MLSKGLYVKKYKKYVLLLHTPNLSCRKLSSLMFFFILLKVLKKVDMYVLGQSDRCWPQIKGNERGGKRRTTYV